MFAAAVHHQVLAGEVFAIVEPVAQLGALKRLQSGELERARQECADAGSDENRASVQLGTAAGFHQETAAGLRLQHRGVFAQVPLRGKPGMS